MDTISFDVIRNRSHDYWFSPSTTGFFKSRYPQCAYQTADGQHAYFVTSERYDWTSPRLYTVRVQDRKTGSVETVGEFQQYASRSGANAAAQRLAASE